MADRYWVGGTGTWDNTTTTNWSTTDGGAGGASVPAIGGTDNVFFTSNSNGGAGSFDVTITTSVNTRDLTISGLAGAMTLAGTSGIGIRGSMTLPSTNLTWSNSGGVVFIGTTTYGSDKTITTSGVIIASAITFNSTAITTSPTNALILQDAFTCTGAMTLSAGTFNLNNYTLTGASFVSTTTNIRTLAFGSSGNINLSGTGTLWNTSTNTNMSITGSKTVNIVYSGATTCTINSGALSLANSINLNVTTGTYLLSIGSSVVNNLNFTGFNGTYTQGVSTSTVYGNLTLSSSMLYSSSSGILTMASTSGTTTITTNGLTFGGNITFNGVGGTFQLADNFSQTVSSTFALTNGTLDINSKTTSVGILTLVTGTRALSNGTLTCASVTHTSGDLSIGAGYLLSTTGTYTFTAGSITINNDVNLSVGAFSSANTNTRSISFGAGSITTNNTGTVWNVTGATGFTYTGTSNIIISNNTATAVTITNTATAANAMNFNIINGTYTLTLTTNNRYNDLNFTGFAGTVAFGSTVHSIYGNLTLGTSTTTSATAGTNTLSWSATAGTKTIITNGRTANFGIALSGVGQTLQLGDAFVQGTTQRFTYTNGTFDLNNYSTSVGILTILSGTHAFTNGTLNCATVTHTSGDLSIGTGYNLTCNGTYTFTAGSITINNGVTLSTSTFSSSNSNIRSIAFGTGAINLTGPGTVWNTATVTNFSYTGTSNVRLTYSGISATTITPGGMSTAQALNFYITAGSYILTITSAGVINNLDFTGFNGTYGQSTVTNILYGNVVFSSTMTSTTLGGTLTMSATSGTKTITTNGHTVGAIITIDGTGGTFQLSDNFTNVSSTAFIIKNGVVDFNNKSVSLGVLTFAMVSASYINYGGILSAASISHDSGVVTIGTGALLVATGAYTFTSGSITINDGVALTVGSFVSTFANVRTIAFGTGSINLTGTGTVWNTSSLTNFSYTGTSNVRLTYSGATATTITTGTATTAAQRQNFFITAGNYTMTLASTAYVNDIDFTGFSGTFSTSTVGMQLFGNITLSNTMTLPSVTSNVAINTNCTIVSSGVVWQQPVAIVAAGSNVVLGDAFTSTYSTGLIFRNGAFNSNGYSVTVPAFKTDIAAGARTLTMGSSDWTITGSGNVWDVSGTQLTLDAGTSNISFTSASEKTFAVSGKQWYNIKQAGAGNLVIGTSGSINTFNDIINTYSAATRVKFATGSDNTVNNFTLSGTAGNKVALTGDAAFTLTKSSGTVTVSYLGISNSTATGGATWLAPTNYGNTDDGANTGWNFSPIGPVTAVLSNMIAFF